MGAGTNSTNTLGHKDETTFEVHKQQVVAYPTKIKNVENELVTFETRHILGHLLAEALVKAGISPDKLLRNKLGKEEIQGFIKTLEPRLTILGKVHSPKINGFMIGDDADEAK